MKSPTQVKMKAKTPPKSARKPQTDFATAPEGFKEIDTSFKNLPAWNFHEKPVLMATVNALEEATITDKKGTRVTMVSHVITDDGEEYNFWMAASLEKFFDILKPGDVIKVVHTGQVDLKGGKTMNTFKCFIKGV